MLRRYPLTVVAISIAVILVAIASLGRLDIIHWKARFLAGIEHNEIDDLVSGFGLVILALAIDRIAADRRAIRAAERRRIVGDTMKAVLEIIGDCREQLGLLRRGVDGVVPPESLQAFDRLLSETTARLETLTDVDDTDVSSSGAGDLQGGVWEAAGERRRFRPG